MLYEMTQMSGSSHKRGKGIPFKGMHTYSISNRDVFISSYIFIAPGKRKQTWGQGAERKTKEERRPKSSCKVLHTTKFRLCPMGHGEPAKETNNNQSLSTTTDVLIGDSLSRRLNREYGFFNMIQVLKYSSCFYIYMHQYTYSSFSMNKIKDSAFQKIHFPVQIHSFIQCTLFVIHLLFARHSVCTGYKAPWFPQQCGGNY